MGIDILRQNIAAEKGIVKELFILISQLKNLEKFRPYEKRESEAKLIFSSISSLISQLKIINNSIPQIIGESLYKKIIPFEKSKELVSFVVAGGSGKELNIAISRQEKNKFI